MNPGAAEVIVLGALAALVALPALAVRDIRQRPAASWRAAGHHRTVWVAAVVLVPVLGAALYYRRVRPRLRAAAR